MTGKVMQEKQVFLERQEKALNWGRGGVASSMVVVII